MNCKIKTILAITVLGVLLICGCVEEQKQEEKQGMWKPDREAERIAVERFKNEVFPDVKRYHITLGTYIDQTNLTPPKQEARVDRYEPPQSYGKEINENEAGKIAIDFIRAHSYFFGVSESDKLEIVRIRKEHKEKFGIAVEFKPQTYKGISFCYRTTNIIILLKDGELKTAIWQWYQNVSAPTKPNITEQEARKILAQKFNVTESDIEAGGEPCIFPFYHENGDFWTYHLARRFGVYTIGGGTVYLDMTTGEVLFVEPLAI